MSTGVILVAAGRGQRFGRGAPKQFVSFLGEPLYVKSLRVFSKLKSIQEMVLVVHPSMRSHFEKKIRAFSFRKKISVVAGGAYRGASVRNGLRHLGSKVKIVLVHDAARPMVTPAIVKNVERATARVGVALAGWPLPDTLKRASSSGRVKKTIPRKNLWVAQTPQGFKRSIADQCLLKPSKTATDDVELAERKGFPVALVPAGPQNIKVTYPHDLKVCQALSKIRW